MADTEALPLYAKLLGADYDVLPEPIRRMHAVAPCVMAQGYGTVTWGRSLAARLLARLLRLPRPGAARPLDVSFVREGGDERLSRRYADRTLTTLQSAAGDSARLAERFGPLDLIFRLQATIEGLEFQLDGVRWRHYPLPRRLWPALVACEFVEADAYCFFVRVDLPLIGRLIQYEGRLAPV